MSDTRELVKRAQGDINWRASAACRPGSGVDPELFWPPSRTDATIQLAKAICDRCEVRADCLAEALVRGEEEGIWGGLTPEEREPSLMRACKRCGSRFVPDGRKRVLCDRCRDGRGRRTPLPCGTRAAYERHILRGEEPCDPCVDAYHAYQQARWQRARQRKREAAGAA